MGKKSDVPASTPTRRRALSDEDARLWHLVSETVTPLTQRRIPPVSGTDGANASAQSDKARKPSPENLTAAAPIALRNNKQKAGKLDSPAPQAKTVAPARPGRSSSGVADFDRRRSRQIARGQRTIDARLDLHGMRQDEALHALRGFLSGAQARGLKFVKVITGKGRRKEANTSWFDDRDTGILRQKVPDWLTSPSLRNYVVSFTSAAQHHGGDGALYVEIRRAGKVRS